MNTEKKNMEQLLDSLSSVQKNEADGSPVYFQLAKRIQQMIEKGTFATGDLIPSERKIASHSNLSLATIRKALEVLVHQGFLKRVQGKGTFVSGTADRYAQVRYYPFVEDFYSSFRISYDCRLVDLKTVKGLSRINRHLKIGDDQKIYELRRIMYHKSRPLVYCISYLPLTLFPKLDQYERENFEKYALYIFLEKEFGITTVNHIEMTRALAADKDTAKILDIEEGHPLLNIEKLALTHKDTPYEYRTSYCLTDDLQLRRTI